LDKFFFHVDPGKILANQVNFLSVFNKKYCLVWLQWEGVDG